jgi:AcrR family transcriptional regulator
MLEFAINGVAGTSAERIAEAAGFTRGAFYANFQNKQDLLLDLIEDRMAAEQASWLELADSKLELESLLNVLHERTMHFDPHGVWSMIAAETHMCALRDPDFALRYRRYHDASRARFMHVVESLFQRAGRRPPLPLEDICDAFLALFRTMRLPPADHPHEAPRPMSPKLLMTMIRGLIAIAVPT